jgi:hypothetical protein
VRYALAALAVVAGALASAARTAPPPLRLTELPGTAALPREPPLAPPQPPVLEVPPLNGSVAAHERVLVGMADDGTPQSVTAVQRLLVRSLGDFAFYIPAPALGVVPAAGSESQPGFRPNQIVWQGFSPRRKVLAAVARLRLADSVAALPIRVRVDGAPVEPGTFTLVLSLENATRARARGFSADVLATDVAAALDALRAAARIERPVASKFVRFRGASVQTTVDVSAPIAVRGTISFPSGSVRDVRQTSFSGLIGGENALALRVTVHGIALRQVTPKVRVVAEPVLNAAPQPPGRSWVAALRQGRVRQASRQLLGRAVTAYLRYARARQYLAFLANPDPLGRSRTTYIFETAPPMAPVASGSSPSGGGGVPAVAVTTGLALLALGLVVLWTRL